MNMEEQALRFASNAHAHQTRKYTLENYIVHPIAVAKIVSCVPHTTEMIQASYLHDVVEDCGVEIKTIRDLFGPKVALLVSQLTDVSKPSDGNRRVRKEIDRQHTADAIPEAKTIKLADLIDNTKSITLYDPDFARVYLEEKQELLKVLKEGDSTLWKAAHKQCHEAIMNNRLLFLERKHGENKRS